MTQDTQSANSSVGPDAVPVGHADRVRVEHSRAQERYEAYVADEYVGYLDYVDEREQVVITHTVIADRFSGHGYGAQLVRHVLDDLAPTHKPIVPVCPFVARFVEKNPAYAPMVVPISR